MRRYAALVVAAGLYLAGSARAERKPFVFDKAHCQINFTAEARFLTAEGYFEKFDGDVQIDPANLGNSILSLSIETASINTRIGRRDNHLRSGDFFDAAHYPKITCVSSKVTRVDDKNLIITGDLTIRGVTKTMQVPTRVVFFEGGRGRFKGQFEINRREFGVSHNPMLNPIEDIVEVRFDLNVLDRQMLEERERQRQQ